MTKSSRSVDLEAYFGVVYFFLFFCCVGIVFYYAEPGFPWHTYVTLIIGYYISFGILLLVPIDIASCVIDRREANLYGDTAFDNYNRNINILSSAYNVLFTLILIWGSFILAYEEYYNTDGYFTIIGKLANSFWRMFRDIILMVIAGVIVLGILLGEHVVSGTSALMLAAVVTTNAVYQFFLMFLLAYGLVEFPRAIWNNSNVEYSLLLTQMKATYDYKEISDYKINIQEEISKVRYFKDQMSKGSPSSNLKYAIEILEAECPSEFKSERKSDTESIQKYLDKGGQITIHGLAALRGDLNLNKDKYKMAQSKVLATEQRAYMLEDLCESKKQGRSTILWSLKNKESTKFEYTWFIVIKPILYKLLAVFLVMLSLFSILGVICSMAGVPNVTSPYFLATHNAQTAGGIVVFIWFSLGYTTYVSLWALFQIRVSGFVELVPFRTSPESLSFNARMCIRLAAPLAFFYLGWIAENGLKTGSWVEFNQNVITYVPTNSTLTNSTYVAIESKKTVLMLSAFSRFYNIQAIAIVKNLFGTGFPIILFILLPLFLTNSFNRFFVMCKMSSMQFGTPIPTDEELAEGKKQLSKFKKIAARAEQRSTLKGHLLNLTKKKTSFFGFFSSGGQLENELSVSQANETSEPEDLKGEIEKKDVSGGYKKMYAEVLSNGYLYFFKDKVSAIEAISAANVDSSNLCSIDLKMIDNITVSTDMKKDGTNCIIIELRKETFKLRFQTPEEMDKWKTLLMEWKVFATEKDALKTSSPVKSKPKFDSKFDENLYDLDNIMVDEDVEKSKKPGAWFGKFGFGSKSEDITKDDITDDVQEKPQPLKGYLDKKAKGKFTSEWQKRYCQVDEESASFLYSKSKEFDEDHGGAIDLRQVVSIAVNNKSTKDAFGRFDIDTGDRVYKFKAKTKVEAENWVANLNLWRDYFLLQMS